MTAQAEWRYASSDTGGVVTVNGRDYPTDYSERIVELLVARKGAERMPRYLRYRSERAGKLEPLFAYLEKLGRPVSVLEPGCSAGHLSEAILAHGCVVRLVSFDPDEGMIEVCREKKRHFGFDRWDVACAASPSFTDETFDVVLMSAMMEHVDPRRRADLVRESYDRLKVGGRLVVLESQNRHWPFEYHVIRLPIPWAHYLPARWIWRLCRAFGRYDASWSFQEFANPNTGWWGTTLAELRAPGVRVREVSEEYGYGLRRYRAEWARQGATGAFKAA
ncbi:MAG: class I SAM-dependent methyltransferase, partial [Deltaproteobacteria bacterium]|nr:class I SAM-dependent methyltransferase [Deltaproteobacteria bacterium]